MLNNQAMFGLLSTIADIHKAGAYHFQVTAVGLLSLSVLSFWNFFKLVLWQFEQYR